MRIGRRDLLRAGAVLGAAALTGCTSRQGGIPVPATTLPSTEKRPAVLRLGVAEYRPYAFTDSSGRLTGEVVEVVRAICAELGSELSVEVMPYEVLLPSVRYGELDVVGGLSIRSDNCEVLDFTVPDHVSLTALVVPKGNPRKLSTFAEVAASGARLAVVADSLEEDAARQAGVTKLQPFPAADLVLRAVTDGQADCAAYDDITLRDMVAGEPALEVRPPFELPGGSPRYGFGFPKGESTRLRDEFDEVLRDLHDSGEWTRIVAPFGFTMSNIPDTERVSDDACAH